MSYRDLVKGDARCLVKWLAQLGRRAQDVCEATVNGVDRGRLVTDVQRSDDVRDVRALQRSGERLRAAGRIDAESTRAFGRRVVPADSK